MLRGMLFSYPPENISLELSGYLVGIHAGEYIDLIFKYTTSDVEKNSLNAILMDAISNFV